MLRNTCALLSLAVLFGAGVAAMGAAAQRPAPGVLLTLAGYFGLTGFTGYTLGPLLAKVMTLPGGGQVVAMAVAATGAIFLALSAWVPNSRRDFGLFGLGGPDE